jgi:hypothetical protein
MKLKKGERMQMRDTKIAANEIGGEDRDISVTCDVTGGVEVVGWGSGSVGARGAAVEGVKGGK